MLNVLDKVKIADIKWVDKQILPLWVYGTLMTGERFHNYLVGCSKNEGNYQMEGTLMRMVSDDVFVRKDSKGDLKPKVAGELYYVSLVGLWRIFHLENQSGVFPKAYDLDVSDVFNMADGEKKDEKKIAIWFRRREEEAIPCQDFKTYTPATSLFEILAESFKNREANLPQSEIDAYLRKELNDREQAFAGHPAQQITLE